MCYSEAVNFLKAVRKALRPFDFVVILFALALTGFSAWTVTGGKGELRVLIRGNAGEWVYPLSAEETVTVPGPLGDTVVRIHHGEAWVEASPCKNQICVQMGRIRRNGAWVACLPNDVSVVIEAAGENENVPDAAVW
jgi:hypothetical protein